MTKSTYTDSQGSIRRHVFAGVCALALLTGGAGWASVTEISSALIAQGSIVVDSNVKKVQHPSGGVVGAVLARDGDRVKVGDVVVRLDPTVTAANLAVVIKGLTEFYARKARLMAERDQVDAVPIPKELADRLGNPDVAEALAGEQRLFELRRTSRVGQKSQLGHRIGQLRQEIIGLTAQQQAKLQEIALIERELVGVRDLSEKGLVLISKLLGLEREAARRMGELGQLVAATAQTEGKIAETELQIIQIDKDLSSEVAKELREIDGKIGEFVERQVAAEDQLKRIDIRAPQDGFVFQSTVHTVGGVITAGDPVMLIVPEADALMVEVKVDPKDIDQLQRSQRVVLRFSAFNQRTTPELYGTVTRIASDTSSDQRTGLNYYVTRIALSAEEIARLGELKLTPGMPVEAFVQTGERTIVSYFTKRFRDQFERALRGP